MKAVRDTGRHKYVSPIEQAAVKPATCFDEAICSVHLVAHITRDGVIGLSCSYNPRHAGCQERQDSTSFVHIEITLAA